MTEPLRQTPLHDWHAAHGARIVPFAGWAMPVQYESITAEHLAVRQAVGVFDISHMGRIRFHGADAGSFLDHLLTRKATRLKPGQIRYALVTNEQGGILDDVLVYRLQDGDAGPDFRLVVNAANRAKIIAWLGRHNDGFDASWTDETETTAMIAVQGPRALSVAQPLLEGQVELNELKYYTGERLTRDDGEWVVSRTGYTGEDGCEITLPASSATGVWESLVDRGATPAGLGARDTLRLEAAMPLYGHELNESIDPIEAGLSFAVQLNDHEFIGRDALAERCETPAARVRIGLDVEGRRVPRQDAVILDGDRPIGQVTSGTFSPTLQHPIAMGYVSAGNAEPGKSLAVDIRGKPAAAVVVPLPFYQRPS